MEKDLEKVKKENEVYLRFGDDSYKEDCRYQLHGPFLFMEDVSERYACACESKVYYQCACLECGKVTDYKMDRGDRSVTVYTNKKDALDDFYAIRERYIQFKSTREQEKCNRYAMQEQFVELLNKEYQEKSTQPKMQYVKRRK